MAKIIFQVDGDQKEKELADGEHVQKTCEALGVPFGCKSGLCGTCKVDVLEGAENLGELTDQEINMERDAQHRLACQCSIKQGNVKIKLGEK
ncbi:MAG: 2Fe-2S iron-sulfur cluster-binding protein [Candidatus Woesearchaeota archaeon]|jgi:ferredoxin|nr:2Fe-2S iron-sulfur cluster-binding protein [Candidatus Woesearchaeota archaeon]